MIAGGRGNEQAPNEKELKAFKSFVSNLEGIGDRISQKKEVPEARISAGIFSLLPTFSRTRSRDDMGTKYVDAELCKECHTCEKLCPYKAIKLDPKPVFDMGKCYGCWSCFNHCPNKAIYTSKYRGVGHYPRPIDRLKEKLAV
jgi:ferredoxin